MTRDEVRERQAQVQAEQTQQRKAVGLYRELASEMRKQGLKPPAPTDDTRVLREMVESIEARR